MNAGRAILRTMEFSHELDVLLLRRGNAHRHLPAPGRGDIA